MGNFERSDLNAYYPLSRQDPSINPFNRPEDCGEVTEDITVAGQTFARSVGIQKCTVKSSNTEWSVFPWVVDTLGLGDYPACAEAPNTGYASFIDASSPAFDPDEDDTSEQVASFDNVAQYVCQNFVPVEFPADVLAEVATASGGAAAPAAGSG
jgi:hypothetical protein